MQHKNTTIILLYVKNVLNILTYNVNMFFVGDKEFNDIDDAIRFHINNPQYELTGKDNKRVLPEVLYTNCTCDNECPKTCFHKEYEYSKTTCHYQWTCECLCGCPNLQQNSCICCWSEVCSDCLSSISENLGFCKVCINNNFTNPDPECGFVPTEEQFKFFKDFYIINPEEDRDKFLHNFIDEYPEIFPE